MKFKCENCGEIDYILIDGYAFGDRLLEGVMFEIRRDGANLIAKVSDSDKTYFDTLNTKKWLKEATDFAEGCDAVECPECGDDIYGLEDQINQKPREVTLTQIDDLLDDSKGNK